MNVNLRILWIFAALSFVPLLFLVQFTGEEAVYTLVPFEMHVAGNLLEPTIHGEPYRRPPLFNWLVLGMVQIGGWDYSLFYVRFVSAASSILSSVAIYLFMRRVLGEQADRSLVAAVMYLTCWQVIGGYGWKGYADALFGFLTLLSILAAWQLIQGARAWFLWSLALALASLSAFLTKAVTVYVFILGFLAASFILDKASRIRIPIQVGPVLLISGGFALLWYYASPYGEIMASGASNDILGRYLAGDASDYLKNLFTFSLQSLLNFFPLSFVVIFCWVYLKSFSSGNKMGDIAGLAAIINFIPYALTPHTHSRYLMPIYGLAAIYAAFLCTQGTFQARRTLILRCFSFIVGLKFLFALLLFPLFTHYKRPNIEKLASDVVLLADGRRIFSTDESWIGLSVADVINRLRVQDGFISKDFDRTPDMVLLARHPVEYLGPPALQYRQEFFVYCSGYGAKGSPCPQGAGGRQ
jgi:4-amino-4-deoxy-L-arabinose transferase-like glycosyltransferase